MHNTRHPLWRRFAAKLALLALLVQASFAVVHSSAMAMHLLAKDFGQEASGVIVICTPAGLKTVRLDGSDGENAPHPNAPEETCPVCTTFATSHVALADTHAVPFRHAVKHASLLPRSQILVFARWHDNFAVRGPPLQV